MSPTSSAILESAPVVAENPLFANDIDFWIKIVSVFSTAFAVFIAAIAIIFVKLTFSHHEQKKKAEKELEEIIKIRMDMSSIFDKVKKHFDLIEKFTNSVSEDSKEIKIIRKKVKASEKDINQRYDNLDNSLKSLATITSVNPGDITTPAGLDLIQDRLDKLMGRKDNRGDIKSAYEEALEMRAKGEGKK